MEKKEITLSFSLEQVCNDVLAKCYLVATGIRDVAMEDIKANVLEPDSPETRSIICRAVTEAFGKVKFACQRYLTVGRTTDNNNLERLVKGVTYVKVPQDVQAEDGEGHPLYLYDDGNITKVLYRDGDVWINAEDDSEEELTEEEVTNYISEKMESIMVDSEEIDKLEYETVVIILRIPNFNPAVTDHLKSSIHKFVVDYVMWRFLEDQVSDKAGEYKKLADGEDYVAITSSLNARDNYTLRRASWI